MDGSSLDVLGAAGSDPSRQTECVMIPARVKPVSDRSPAAGRAPAGRGLHRRRQKDPAGDPSRTASLAQHLVLHGRAADDAADARFFPVSELADLPNKYLHQPWEAPEDVLKAAGVKLGENYPEPIIAHTSSITQTLACT